MMRRWAPSVFATAWQMLLLGLVGLAGCHCTEAICEAIAKRNDVVAAESRPEENGGEGERRPPVRR